MAKTVVGLFDKLEDARRAIEDLTDSGFDRRDISLVASDPNREYQGQMTEDEGNVAGGTVAGAGIGAVLGGLGGLLVGLGALAIPGIGPVIAAGPLVSALAGAGIGAAAGGLIGALVDLGIPEQDANYYAEGVRRGGALVTLKTSDELADEAADILNRHNPVDVERRVSHWREQEGWTGYDREAQPYTPDNVQMDEELYPARSPGETEEQGQYSAWSPTEAEEQEQQSAWPVGEPEAQPAGMADLPGYESRDHEIMDVVEEEMEVGKRSEISDRVRIHTHVSEHPVEETVNLRKERIDVERRPADRPATDQDLESFRDETFEVTATSEEPVVEKRARVVEDVEVHKYVEDEEHTVRDTVRRKDVDVEQMGPDEAHNMDQINEYEPLFRQHYTSNFSGTDYSYDDYMVAYTYGYDLANSDRYSDYQWEDLEPEARRNWERYNQDSAWDDFKDAVRQGWESVKRTFE